MQTVEIQRGVDQGDMGKRLREITQHPPGARVVLLRQQSDVVPQRKKPFEQSRGFVVPAKQHVVVGQPEAAGQENALAGRESIGRRYRCRSADQAIGIRSRSIASIGAAHARVRPAAETDQRQQQQAGIQSFDP